MKLDTKTRISDAPIRVADLEGVSKISAGKDFSVAIVDLWKNLFYRFIFLRYSLIIRASEGQVNDEELTVLKQLISTTGYEYVSSYLQDLDTMTTQRKIL